MGNYTAAQKLWKIIRERDNFYYEIKLSGEVIDRIRIEEPALKYIKEKGLV